VPFDTSTAARNVLNEIVKGCHNRLTLVDGAALATPGTGDGDE
jgi:hypothetical protein